VRPGLTPWFEAYEWFRCAVQYLLRRRARPLPRDMGMGRVGRGTGPALKCGEVARQVGSNAWDSPVQ
jgi:hypothetical protein